MLTQDKRVDQQCWNELNDAPLKGLRPGGSTEGNSHSGLYTVYINSLDIDSHSFTYRKVPRVIVMTGGTVLC